MVSKDIKIADETLRDGEQQPYINFSKDQKISLAKDIFNSGVDYITLMPVSSDFEFRLAKEISEIGPVLCLTPCREEDIIKSLEISNNILLYQAVSDALLMHRNKGKSLEEARKSNLEKIIDSVTSAAKQGATIQFGLEDVTRADLNYVKTVLNAIEDYVCNICIADSVGASKPEEIKKLVAFVKSNTAHPISIHTHNDLGLADENAIAAVEAGADYISGTFTGIGERAGNMNLGNVITMLEKRGYKVRVSSEDAGVLDKKVYEYAKRAASLPNTEETFWHESGMHAHAFLNGDPLAYSAVNPADLGFEHKILFGKKSGISNFKYYLGDRYSDSEYRAFLAKIKELSIQNQKTYTFREVCEILGIS
jgi:isopropylmalate/homocitrate/citramalate synthase